MTFEELQEKATEAKRVSDKIALLNNLKDQCLLREKTGGYVDGLLSQEVLAAGFDAVIARESEKLGAMLK